MLLLGILMLIAIILMLIPQTKGSPVIAFMAGAGGLFGFLWFLLILLRWLLGQPTPTLGS
jgi:hypothetical protein